MDEKRHAQLIDALSAEVGRLTTENLYMRILFQEAQAQLAALQMPEPVQPPPEPEEALQATL